MEKLASDKENVCNQITHKRIQADEKREEISKMAETALKLKEKCVEYAASAEISDSRTAYSLSLYSKISNISWDYSAPEGSLEGCKKTYFLRYHTSLLRSLNVIYYFM